MPTRLLDESSAPEPLPPIRLVDFHCELTSEKNALGLYLDGRVSAVVGTHTHVVTGDERILPGGTAYQTDLGMTGPVWSVIGFDPTTVLPRFINALPTRFEVGEGAGGVQRRPDRHRRGDRPRARHRAHPAARGAVGTADHAGSTRRAPVTPARSRSGRRGGPAEAVVGGPPHPLDAIRRRAAADRAHPRRRRGRCPGLLADRPRHAGRLPGPDRGGGRTGGDDADPRRRDQRARHPRSRAVGVGAAHPRLRDGPGRPGIRSDPVPATRRPPGAVRSDGRAIARDRDADRRPGGTSSSRTTTMRSAGRRSPAP